MTSTQNAPDRYNHIARILHWLVAGGIVLQYVLANLAENAESRFQQFVLLANHKSVGMTILAIALVRLVWRFASPRPAALVMPTWQRIAANVSHGALYALLFLMPLSGWLMSSASNIPVSWFNLFAFPDLVGANEMLADRFELGHETMAKVLFAFAALHVAGALKHLFIDRDGVFRRISSPVALLGFVLVVAAGVFLLVPESRADEPNSAWQIDYEASSIRFEAEQAGAKFEGEWTDWEASMHFDPAALDNARFDVTIRVAGVATGDSDRDETLVQDGEFFAAEQFPEARYLAEEFTARDDGGFTASGSLTIKDVSQPAPLEFTVTADGSERRLEGSARLDRLALGLGTGEWSDTEWIGQFVDVRVVVIATVP